MATTAPSEQFFTTELDALLYSVQHGDPMNVAYAGDGYWTTPKAIGRQVSS